MSALDLLIIIGFIHCSLFFFNILFRSCLHYPYFLFMENTGLEIKPLRIIWFTSFFNRNILKWSMDKTKLLSLWFNLGVIVSIILLPIAFGFIIKMTISNFLDKSAEGGPVDDNWQLEPMIPGINVPVSDIQYYVITLGICSIFHEMGHAVAASRENVQVYGVGFILAFILPIAYVSINHEQMKLLKIGGQLRILCAGVWHNIILAIIAAAIFSSNSWIWAPLYISNSGVYVTSIATNSPLLGPRGLETFDVIYKINNCDVKNNDDWYHCLLQTIKRPSSGYCVEQTFIEEHDESIPSWMTENGVTNCCEDNKNDENLCFEYVENLQDPLELPPYFCLPARKIIEHSEGLCQLFTDCLGSEVHCIKPSLDNITKVVKISTQKNNVLFLGHPADIYRTVETSNWTPKYQIFSPNLPESLELLCKYITVLSAGLAVINIIPCFFFDGQYIIESLVQSILRSFVRHKSARNSIALIITCTGSVFFVINLIVTLIKIY
ncbi:membrane-bound transcription factor site-2 protease isoform X1 [Microplitis mediator]|uniref:membrane-bound transcription factor site-2 protease isoform X1 n=2 Tax=Microplitis mediator TaxID=375433 RepID=UPI002554D1AA|nr:membrane-bound transcription factor site-2 protease isoform X1 [Microplitis mediator]XP_057341013.1 membrane-bound transcription factor site-2 protease isoform X1 [Microplitis mediator]